MGWVGGSTEKDGAVRIRGNTTRIGIKSFHRYLWETRRKRGLPLGEVGAPFCKDGLKGSFLLWEVVGLVHASTSLLLRG
jgi:hypothetical protein